MRRVSIADIMRESGLSRATVDRVLNGRGLVHPRTRAVVEETVRRLSTPMSSPGQKGPAVDVVLRLGQGMMGQMRAAWDRLAPTGNFHDMYQAQEADMLAIVVSLCRDTERPLIITAKNTDQMAVVLREGRARGKRIVALISDLAQDARDVFVGIDNRAAGQTAAFLIGRVLGDRPTSVGVVLGDPAFRCHEDREIGFRSALRTHFPKVVLAGEAMGEDSPSRTQDAVLRLLKEQPALGAIYNVGGGNLGLIEALGEASRADDLLLVGHETNAITIPLLREGSMDFAIAQDPATLLTEAWRQATKQSEPQTRDSVLLDFAVYTRFNLPAFGQPAVGPLL